MSVSIRNRNLWIPNEQTNTCRACLSVCLSSFYICRLDLRCAVEWMFGDKIRDVSIYFFYFNENKSNDEGTRSKTNWSTLKHTNNFFSSYKDRFAHHIQSIDWIRIMMIVCFCMLLFTQTFVITAFESVLSKFRF